MSTILLLGPSLSAVSGVSTHLNQLMGSPLAVDYKLIHFQIGSEGRQETKLQKLLRFIFSPIALTGVILKTSPDIVHLNTSLEQKAFWRDALYLMVAKILHKHVVYQVHGGELPQQFFKGNRFLDGFLRQVLIWPDAVVLLASVEYQAYKTFTDIKRLMVIPNAIDLPGDVEVKPICVETTRLGFIGRLADNKGVFEAIEAVNILVTVGLDNITLTIAGSGPFEAELRKKVTSLGMDNIVFFAGALFGQSKNDFWRETDLFVFPTYHREGLPYTVLESLASGTPMITTRVGAIPDVIEDGVHGVFVEPHDPHAVAVAIKSLIDDREKIKSMSIACTARAREFYGVDRLARQFSELYNSIIH